jgi:uncharacterized protein with GYD domain
MPRYVDTGTTLGASLSAEATVARYLIRASYTPESWAAMMKTPQDRREAARGVIEAAGGKLASFDFALGGDDVVVIVDFPNNVSAAAAAIAITSSGALKSYTTTALMSPEEAVEAMRQAAAITYRPPA